MAAPDGPGVALARRLRALRTSTWPAHPLTQLQVAHALNVSAPSISSWESERDPKVPPVDRIRAYARLFGAERSVERGKVRLLAEGQLNTDEQASVGALESELLLLHQAASGSAPARAEPPRVNEWPATDFWRFGRGVDVTIVCAPLPEDFRARMPYSDPKDPDYIELHTFADLDALLELYGHMRAVNPHSNVNIRLASALQKDDYTAHLIVLGGVDWNALTRDVLNDVDLPVRQVPSTDSQTAAFEVLDGGKRRTFSPILRPDGDAQLLDEDVAHFFRAPNPFNGARTVTICNGVFGRGTYAAVRSLTDARFRVRNTMYVRDRFGDSPTFSILARVRVRGGEPVTPDWTLPHIRLHEWPS
jgi:transcriptional regulator with XRE-family HTH domain